MPVNVPGQSPGLLKSVVPMVGTAVGGYFGGPAGAAAGGKIGSSLVAGGMDPGAVEGKGGAMARRLSTPDPQEQLAQAQNALAQLPPEEQAKYKSTLDEAQKRAGGY